MLGPQHAFRIDVDVKVLAQGAEVADLPVRLIDLDEGTKLAGVERVAEKEEEEVNGQP